MRYSHLSDEELVERYQSGKGDHQEYGDAIVKRFHGVCRFEARDSVQTYFDADTRESECRLALYRAMGTYKTGNGTSFRSYAKRLMRRSMIDLSRAASRRINEVDIDSLSTSAESLLDVTIAGKSDTGDDAAEAIIFDAIQRSLGQSVMHTYAFRICEALNPEAWEKLVGQASIFDDPGAFVAERGHLASQVTQFALAVLDLRSQGYTYEESGESLGVKADVCGLAISWIASMIAEDEPERKTKSLPDPKKGKEQKPIAGGLFAAYVGVYETCN